MWSRSPIIILHTWLHNPVHLEHTGLGWKHTCRPAVTCATHFEHLLPKQQLLRLTCECCARKVDIMRQPASPWQRISCIAFLLASIWACGASPCPKTSCVQLYITCISDAGGPWDSHLRAAHALCAVVWMDWLVCMAVHSRGWVDAGCNQCKTGARHLHDHADRCPAFPPPNKFVLAGGAKADACADQSNAVLVSGVPQCVCVCGGMGRLFNIPKLVCTLVGWPEPTVWHVKGVSLAHWGSHSSVQEYQWPYCCLQVQKLSSTQH